MEWSGREEEERMWKEEWMKVEVGGICVWSSNEDGDGGDGGGI